MFGLLGSAEDAWAGTEFFSLVAALTGAGCRTVCETVGRAAGPRLFLISATAASASARSPMPKPYGDSVSPTGSGCAWTRTAFDDVPEVSAVPAHDAEIFHSPAELMVFWSENAPVLSDVTVWVTAVPEGSV